jgi:peptidoglycan/LPS O-acetylase OafA/YrhL
VILEGKQRIETLNGLRGLAALSVVLYHITLACPNLFGEGAGAKYIHLVSHTPLGLAIDGKTSVSLFFVLSGFVLVLSLRIYPSLNWIPARLVRLYLPVLVIVALTSLCALQTRDATRVYGWYLRNQINVFGMKDFLENSFLLDHTTLSNGNLWTMRIEVIFSLILPALVLSGLITKTSQKKFIVFLLLNVTFFCIFCQYDDGQNQIMKYFPFFLGGVMLHLLSDKKKFADLRIFLCLFVLFSFPAFHVVSQWMPVSVQASMPIIFRGSNLIAAIMLVDSLRAETSLLGEFLRSKPISSLGKYSFSLYLIHAPILSSLFFMFPTIRSFRQLSVAALFYALMLLVCTFTFYRFVEAPIHHLSKKILKKLT